MQEFIYLRREAVDEASGQAKAVLAAESQQAGLGEGGKEPASASCL